jgi:pyruvate formate lyase activating enzyme
MDAAGLQKNSLIDYPGKVSCVVFLSGCNFACPYCHNPELARGEHPTRIPLGHLLDFVSERRHFLDGVVITGGEPALHVDLPDWCRAFRRKGLAVKLDTNGSRPDVLTKLIHEKTIDYIAMDIKTTPSGYGPPLCPSTDARHITHSIDLIMDSGLPYEFRTTCARPFIDRANIDAIGRAIENARQWTLHTFQPNTLLKPDFYGHSNPGFSPEAMTDLQQAAARWVRTCFIR